MSNTIIKIMVAQGAPKETKEEYKPMALCDKVKECVRRVKSNQIDSEREWSYLKTVYEKLSKKKRLSEEEADMLEELEELMAKYAKHDHEDSVDMDAQRMHRNSYRGED